MILLAFIPSLFFSLQAEDWYAMEADAFFEQPAVHQEIDPSDPDYDLLAAAIFHATNQARQAEGLSALSHALALQKAANLHSENMRTKKFFAHKDPRNKRLRTPQLRIEKFGGNYSAFGENIARYPIYNLDENGSFFVTPQGNLVNKQNQPLKARTYASLAEIIVSGWMNSPGHRANILGNYDLLGIGLSEIFNENKKPIPELLITQNFGLK